MTRLFHPILAFLAGADIKQLAAQVAYLKTENEMLRKRLPKRIVLEVGEKRRLAKLAAAVRGAIKQIATIACPATVLRWIREFEDRGSAPIPGSQRKPGRPRTGDEIRTLVLEIARDTGWGYTRILGQLRRLGIISISRQTVKAILKENGFDPGPRRGLGSWAEFLKAHAETLWQADFLSVKVWTPKGLVEYFAIAFLHVGSRRVWVTPFTASPDSVWVQQQARNFSMTTDAPLQAILYLDRDTKFTKKFRDMLTASGFRTIQCPVGAPNMKPHVERWIQSLRQECLNAFVILGEKHLSFLAREYVDYFNNRRAHSSLEFASPNTRGSPPMERDAGPVVRRQRLGGVLNWYERQAA
jgi:putative transposase